MPWGTVGYVLRLCCLGWGGTWVFFRHGFLDGGSKFFHSTCRVNHGYNNSMIRKWNSFLLVALLTFLQCLAPLLHAHTGGLHTNEAGHVHLDALNVGPVEVHTVFRADAADTPSVSVPAEYRRDPTPPGGESPCAIPVAPYPVPPVGTLVFSTDIPYFLFLSPRLTPPAQAPPAAV